MAIGEFGGSKPASFHWCIFRTAANASMVNAYLNQTQNLDGFYSKTEEKWITSDTKKGVSGTGPSDKKPNSKYRVLNDQEFLDLVINGQGADRKKLPTYWAVKHDGSQRFVTEVLGYINSKKGSGKAFTGSSGSFYGYDGEYCARTTVDGFSANVTLLSIDDFLAIINPTAKSKTIKVRKSNILATPPREEVIDFILRKKYPGSQPVGTYGSQIKTIATPSTDTLFNDPDFKDLWEPVRGVFFRIGDIIKITNSTHPKVGGIFTITRAEAMSGKRQNIELNLTSQPRTLYSTDIKLATQDEIDNDGLVVINGESAIAMEQGIKFGKTIVRKTTLEDLALIMEQNPGTTLNVVKTPVTYEMLEEILEQSDE